MSVALAGPVAQVRSFNRFWTRQIGVLGKGLLASPYSLTEARILFELAQRESVEAGALREALELDGGYLSRILQRFTREKLIATSASPGDARRVSARLTARGRKVFAALDARSDEEARALLEKLPHESQRRVVGAMGAIRGALERGPEPQAILLRAPVAGDFGWVVQRHGALYAEEHGWDETFEALVARIVAGYIEEHDAKREAAWIAEVDGERAGCIFCVEKSAKVAQLRLLLLEPRARGLGLGKRLVEECLQFARRAGYQKMVLWTNHPLTAARRLYQSAGFALDEEKKHHSFGKDLVGQSFSLRL